jgi:hypothetical protein
MAQVAPGKMLAMCESGVPLNPDLMAKSGPKWLYNLQWFEGEVEWDRKVLGHELITTFAELPPLTPFHAPPSVRLTAPGDGAHSDGEAVELRAEATAREGALAKVEYYRLAAAWQNWFLTKDEERQQALAGATLLAATTPPFAATWRQAPAGLHNVIAKATDAQGAVAWSNVARVAIGAVNLAAGRPTTASTRPEAAAKAVDGSLFTAWNGPKPGSKAKPTDPVVPAEQWLAVDLGAEQTVGCLVVSWWKAYARSYRLEVSPDGQAWREVARQDNKRTFEGNSDVHRFPPVKARHVRLLCLAPGTDWGGYTVYELGVYTALAGG